MDMTESAAPRSDQINNEDLIAGPQTFTIREVVPGRSEVAPFDFLLVETERAYRPNKTMRKLIISAWGPKTPEYAGKMLTLYREPSIRFGKTQPGGIRISHMSGIEKPVEQTLQVTRGTFEKFVVNPLSRADQLRAEWRTADPERRKVIEAEVTQLTGGAA